MCLISWFPRGYLTLLNKLCCQTDLNAVLVLIGLQGHDLELAGGHQLFVDGTVDVEVVEGRRVLGASADSTARKTDVVRRAENENSFHLQKKNSKLTTTRD